jgi:precorrin-3B synthase
VPAVPPPPPRAPADRCPGALRPHQALDGPLVRLRLPGGQICAPALRAVAGAAADLGDGWLELTSRGNIQLRGLTADGAVSAVADRCADAGLLPSETHERVRNILGSPLSGRDGHGDTDIRPLLTALDTALCSDPVLAGLPGRFSFALDDGRGDVIGLGADIGWRAGTDRLLLAGRDAGLHMPATRVVDAMLAAARAFLHLGGGTDGIWRLTDLAGGVERITESLLAAGPNSSPILEIQGTFSSPEFPRSREGAGGPAPGLRSAGASACAVLAVPLGRLAASQAVLLADTAAAAGGGVVVTPWRQVVVDLAADRADERVRHLTGAGLVEDPGSPWVALSACAGIDGCGSARGDVRADARALAETAPVRTIPRAVHWAGCERQCGRPAGPALVLIATGGGYLADPPDGPQRTADSPAAARDLAATWRGARP